MLKEILTLGHEENFWRCDGCPQKTEEPSSQRGSGLILFCSKEMNY